MNPYQSEPTDRQDDDLTSLKNTLYIMMACQCVFAILQLVTSIAVLGVAFRYIKINL